MQDRARPPDLPPFPVHSFHVQIVDLVFDTMREPHTAVPVPAAFARLACKPFDWLTTKTPFRPFYMLSSDFVDQLSADLVLPPAQEGSGGVLRIEDLGLEAHRVTRGLPIEFLRHYRVGGYDFGSLDVHEGEPLAPPIRRAAS